MTSLLCAYAAARGVTARGILGYFVAWILVSLASRVSISAMGLNFAPRGSAALDTLAVLVMIVPAAILAGCLTSQTPTLEATRSRPRLLDRLLWVAAMTGVAVVSALIVSPTLHQSVNSTAFCATWCITTGVWFCFTAIASRVFAGMVSFALVAIFSTPNLIPWKLNVIFNLDHVTAAVWLGLAVLAVGVVLQVAKAHVN